MRARCRWRAALAAIAIALVVPAALAHTKSETHSVWDIAADRVHLAAGHLDGDTVEGPHPAEVLGDVPHPQNRITVSHLFASWRADGNRTPVAVARHRRPD